MKLKGKHNLIILLWILFLSFVLNTNLTAQARNIINPPIEPRVLSGQDSVCIYETTTYIIDLPLSCITNWYINGILQPDTGNIFTTMWIEPGLHDIDAYIVCNTSTSFAGSASVFVKDIPIVDLGNDTILNEGQTILLDAGNQGSYYLWTTGDTTQTILVSNPGNYGVTVTNPCGSSFDEINIEFYTYIEELTTFPFSVLNGVILFTEDVNSYEVYDASGNCITKGSGHESYRSYKSGFYIINIRLKSGKNLISKIIVQ